MFGFSQTRKFLSASDGVFTQLFACLSPQDLQIVIEVKHPVYIIVLAMVTLCLYSSSYMIDCLFGFYSISTFVGYLMPTKQWSVEAINLIDNISINFNVILVNIFDKVRCHVNVIFIFA